MAPLPVVEDVCVGGGLRRSFNVVAINVSIVYNKAGEHDHRGNMYALAEDVPRIMEQVAANPRLPADLVRPLVIRANAGDVVAVNFENRLAFPASIHIQDVRHDVHVSDGAAVGENPSSVAAPGDRLTYLWRPDREGIFPFSDLGNPVSDETGSNVHGLFGAFIVQAPGSTWTDPQTGNELTSGACADIHNPAAADFREFTLIFHDEVAVVSGHGQPPPAPAVDHGLETHAINYRAEPSRIRMGGIDCAGEDCMMSSWAHGDPATPVLHTYLGDPIRIRLIHGGVKETHVFHLHVYQWRLDPDDPNSTLIDSITFGPQTTYTIAPLHGAGSLQQAVGDAIYHCHLYPHFDAGMWGLLRAHDVLEDGTRSYPDGSPITRLVPLPDRPAPPPPTAERPGFPLFIPGEFGRRAPKPPLGIVGGREPTALEVANFAPNPVPGAMFTNPRPDGAPVRRYDIVGIQMPLRYNRNGWHDPEGRLFVLAEDEEAVLSGEREPEPLVIRANAGECIDATFTNKFPTTIGGNAFQSVHATLSAALHIHLVKFDVLCADSAMNGWNYDSSADYGQTLRLRWYADRELRTVFFHDHLFANLHQQHGVFAGLIIEPAGSSYHDPYTGAEIKSGTRAVIKNPSLPDFREFVLAVHDRTPLFDAGGRPLNPPAFPDSHGDSGVMAINYKNEPFRFRAGDPAYVFSSFVHGDPVTPILEAYSGDPVRIRLLHGAHEEQHAFNLHGQRWHREPTDPKSPLVSMQVIGISEAFNLEFTADGPAGGDAGGDADLLYYCGGLDDVWVGMWGIMRLYGQRVERLLPLADREAPPERTWPVPCRASGRSPRAAGPGTSCLPENPVRHYDVVAIQMPIVYNKSGDRDPDGLLFVLAEDEAATVACRKPAVPLILRANAGDCVEVTLTNHLPPVLAPTVYPDVPVSAPWAPSTRVSLHAQLLRYDARGSDGATVGFNPDQTVGRGESITYRWLADQELGAVNLMSYGDIRNHRHRGLYGALIIEPVGSRYLDPWTSAPLRSGEQAVICRSGLPDFREFVVVAVNGLGLLDANGVRVPDAGAAADFEDQGVKGFNYRSELFIRRFAVNPDRSLVFSSAVHGDPATPLFQSYPGERVVFRYLMAADKPRNTVLAIHGPSWLTQPGDPFSNLFSAVGGASIGTAHNIYLDGKLGTLPRRAGDYLYRSGAIRWDIEQGMWGIWRVHAARVPALAPLTEGAGLAGAAPGEVTGAAPGEVVIAGRSRRLAPG
jgi:FtsP/CotA-like multicopper oxidase with cupredoxin domain